MKKAKSNFKVVELKPNKKYLYNLKTKEYGRINFGICFVLKRGKLVELWMSKMQDPTGFVMYHYKLPEAYTPIDWSISSWEHKSIEVPRIWKSGYCEVHKTMYLDVYPPDGTNCFYITTLSNFGIQFDTVKS